jgi:hypothetical protein
MVTGGNRAAENSRFCSIDQGKRDGIVSSKGHGGALRCEALPIVPWLALVSGIEQAGVLFPSRSIIAEHVLSWGGNHDIVRLIVCAAIDRPFMYPDMMNPSRLRRIRVSSEHRRGNGGGQNDRSAERFDVGHLDFSVRVSEAISGSHSKDSGRGL